MKIATIVGARPQFVKAAVVSRAVGELPNAVHEILIHTGQHYDTTMSKVFFDELNIPEPAYNLGIGGGTHGQNTGRMIEEIEQVLLAEQPDWVLVYGDTDSTLAGAVAAAKLHIRVAHVEAGLRSFNRRMPEEINRVLTDHSADLLFSPTDVATANLAREGIFGKSVCQVGDVMYDATLHFADRAQRRSCILAKLGLSPKAYILVTVHRAENTDDPERLREIVEGLADSGRDVVWPMHPRTLDRIQEFAVGISDNIRIIAPIGYLDMVMLERHAAMIATDSGGVQKEAYFHGVRCVILRDETEWSELVEIGVNHLAGADRMRISRLLGGRNDPQTQSKQLYGDGRSAHRIVEVLSSNT